MCSQPVCLQAVLCMCRDGGLCWSIQILYTAESGQTCAARGVVLVCTHISLSATISKCSNLLRHEHFVPVFYVCVFLMVFCSNTEPRVQVIARKAECGSLVHRFVPLYVILFQVRSEGTGK